jgi:hypothetical protein
MLVVSNKANSKQNVVTGIAMSDWNPTCFLLLLFAANALPALARQGEETYRFPKRLHEAIDPNANSQHRSAQDTRSRLTTNNEASLDPAADPDFDLSRRDGAATPLGHLRSTPARKVSSQRVIGTRAAPSANRISSRFEFGTVMMFPAAVDRQQSNPISGMYKPPSITRIESEFGRPDQNFSIVGGQRTSEPGFRLVSQSKTSPAGDLPLLALSSPSESPESNTVLSISVYGPLTLTPDSPGEFEIVVANSSQQPAREIIIQLTTPGGITICELDRQAWLDEEQRTVSWTVAQIPSGYKTSIRYSVISETGGLHRQRITVGMDDVFQGATTFETSTLIPTDQETTGQAKDE